jgi:hypothetical protein
VKLRNEGLRRVKWVEHTVYMTEIRSTNKIIDGKPQGKRPVERRRRRW